MRFVSCVRWAASARRGIVRRARAGCISAARRWAQDDDLPGRVGRVAEFAGQTLACHRRTDRPIGSPIGINFPITSGVNLWVSGDGRAEVDYGGGQFRLAGDTNVHVARLDDRELALFIAQGQVIVRVRCRTRATRRASTRRIRKSR